jgi:hypothetical protein
MHVLIFSATFVGNISHSKKNLVRHYHKCTLIFCDKWVPVTTAWCVLRLCLDGGMASNTEGRSEYIE